MVIPILAKIGTDVFNHGMPVKIDSDETFKELI